MDNVLVTNHMNGIYFNLNIIHLLAEIPSLCQLLKSFYYLQYLHQIFQFHHISQVIFSVLSTIFVRVWYIIISVFFVVIVVEKLFVNVDIKYKYNKYTVKNDLQVKLPEICVAEIFPRD